MSDTTNQPGATPSRQAVYEVLAYLLDHENEMRSGWHEADAFLEQLAKRGFMIIDATPMTAAELRELVMGMPVDRKGGSVG